MLVLYIPLYFHLDDDDDLSLKPVEGSKFMYTLKLYYVHMLVCINNNQYFIVCNIILYLPKYQTTAIQL